MNPNQVLFDEIGAKVGDVIHFTTRCQSVEAEILSIHEFTQKDRVPYLRIYLRHSYGEVQSFPATEVFELVKSKRAKDTIEAAKKAKEEAEKEEERILLAINTLQFLGYRDAPDFAEMIDDMKAKLGEAHIVAKAAKKAYCELLETK